MKKTFALARLAILGLGICPFITNFVRADERTNYVTATEITAMAPCTATFAKRLSEYSGLFTNVEGKRIVLGDARGEQWVWHFVGELKEGQTYKFPEVFTNYVAAPSYVTAREIASMAPCTGTIASRSPCSSCFSATNGTWFNIGGPSSGLEVNQFIWSLKDGETCAFPDNFLSFEKTNSKAKKR